MTLRGAFIDGIGFWSDLLPGWPQASAAFTASADASPGAAPACPGEPVKRPTPAGLSAAERRRAPDSVCVAVHTAEQAVADSGHAPESMECVFASAHGDLGLTDYMCATVVTDATAISPTRFHNSVHNAPAGYWTMATQCRQASTALAAFERSFAAGLLEALSQCAVNQAPVLLCAYDIAATGALANVTRSEHMLGFALVLSPRQGPNSRFELAWTLAPHEPPSRVVSPAARGLAVNAMADSLPFCEALARNSPDPVILDAGDSISLIIRSKPTDY